jgi:uncharacterized membrane protein
MDKKIEKEIINAMSKDPGNWKRFVYYNPKDYRILVPKQNPSMGWTLNFASRYAYIIMFAVFLIVGVAIYLNISS